MAVKDGGVMRSTNSGTNWAEFDTGFGALGGAADPLLAPVETIAMNPLDSTNVLVGVTGGGMWQLGGSTWTTAGFPSALVNGPLLPHSVTFSPSGQIFVSLFNAQISTWGGGLWTGTGGVGTVTQRPYPDNIVNCGAAGPYASAHKVVPTSSAAYLIRYDGLPQRSPSQFTATDASCVNAPSIGFERLYFHDLAEQPNNANILVGATNKGIYRSTDAGANWTHLAISGAPSQVFSGIAFISGGILYGVTRAGGLYCSSDNAVTWSTVSLGTLPSVPFRGIKTINGNIHIVTDGGGVYTGFAQTCP
jgi:hypothetical protein